MSPRSITSTLAAHPSILEETMRKIAAGLLHAIELHEDAHKWAIKRYEDVQKEREVVHEWAT
jgi:hypothetical protein